MKGFGIAILFLLAAVQGRNVDTNGIEFPDLSGTEAQLGENPWVVHLRVAKEGAEGLLQTCVGSLIAPSWVLTTASCVEKARFVWIRYATLDPVRPGLVTETSLVSIYPGYDAATGKDNIALVNLNRDVSFTDNIRPIALAGVDADGDTPDKGKFCVYSGKYDDPREILQCFDVNLTYLDDGTIVAVEMGSLRYKFDHGSPLVSDGVQIGVLSELTEAWSNNIRPIALAGVDADGDTPDKGKFCVYSGKYDDPREILQCFDVNLTYLDDGTIVAVEMGSLRYKFDHGSPLVSDGVQIGVLSELTEAWSTFVRPSVYRDWIQSVTGQEL